MMPLDAKMTAKYNHLEMGNILIFQPDLSAEESVLFSASVLGLIAASFDEHR